jgi:predicted CopG family antitoxin
LRKKSFRYRALVGSVVIHILLLSCFAVIEFTETESTETSKKQAISVALKKVVQEPTFVKKPKYKPSFQKNSSIVKLEKPADKIELSKANPKSDNQEYSGKTVDVKEMSQTEESSVSFFESRVYARKICYVVDCSGSMLGTFSLVQKKLCESVGELEPDQFFEIIFFSDNNLSKLSNGTLIRATPSAKSKAERFISITQPGGSTNAIQALSEALKIKDPKYKPPHLLYFLTDGFDLSGKNKESFSQTVDKLLQSARQNIQINVIAFYPQESDKKILEKIAENTNGEVIIY